MFPFTLSSVPYRDLEPLSKQLTIVIGLTVVGFMAFGLALSFYRNLLFDQTLQSLSEQNDKLRQQNADSQQTLSYLQSSEYKDKYAKENFGKANPGDHVLIIADTKPENAVQSDDQNASDQKQAMFEEVLRQMPVIDHWKLYLFEPDKLDQLRKGL